MNTVADYNIVFERARKRLEKSAKDFTVSQFREIADANEISFQTVFDYCRRGIGKNLKTMLEIQGMIFKYKHEKK